jgi:hypothetical protein
MRGSHVSRSIAISSAEERSGKSGGGTHSVFLGNKGIVKVEIL